MRRLPQKYRIVKSILEEGDEEDPTSYIYTIREVYHREDGNIHTISEETFPTGFTRMELQEELLKMINALIYPTLNEDGEEIE